MLYQKKLIINIEILNLLKELLKKNNLFDIWVYGNTSDKHSDLDLIFIYKKDSKKKLFRNNIFKIKKDASVIITTNNVCNDIFYFDFLNIYSVKKNKMIKNNLNKKYKKTIYFLSVIDRYFERRSKIIKIKTLNEKNLRIIKSYFYSLAHFLEINNSTKLKKIFNSNLKKYWITRKKFKFNQSNLLIKEIKHCDIKNFYPEIIKYCEKIYPLKNFDGKLNIKNAMKFQTFNKKKIDYVPKIVLRIYYEYSIKKFYIFKKLKKCIKINKNFKSKKIDKDINFVINKKINFLISSCKKINQLKIKSGLYRLNWFV